MKPKKQIKNIESSSKIIGMKPLLGYQAIDKEEREELRKMTMKDARIQTEALLRAAQWMK